MIQINALKQGRVARVYAFCYSICKHANVAKLLQKYQVVSIVEIDLKMYDAVADRL